MGLFDKLLRKNKKVEEPINEVSTTAPIPIPPYLCYPDDSLSRKMFESQMKDIVDERCGYRFKLYTGTADPVPEIRTQSPSFDIHETHIFSKEGNSAWYSVSTMKTPSVKTSNLLNWVEANDQMGMMFGNMIPFLNLPSGRENSEYRRVQMYALGVHPSYNREHLFEEACTYCHVFYLDNVLYKKFILIARKDIYSWKVECTFPSTTEALTPADMVPPGQTFGSFFPCF